MTKQPEIRFIVVKDYYRGDQPFTDSWPILYGTEAEAEAVKERLEAGQDQSWFDPSPDSDESAFLYVDCITL